jgi:WD40 repeat protein
VTTLDSHIRLLDLSTGQVLNTFKGHTGKEYRVRACFGAAEASVVCGDEDGRVWEWDLVDVSFTLVFYWFIIVLTVYLPRQATILQPNPPPKAHEKVITWTEHHPTDAGEIITASADGTCKVWRHPNGTVGAWSRIIRMFLLQVENGTLEAAKPSIDNPNSTIMYKVSILDITAWPDLLPLRNKDDVNHLKEV